ncbi:MAG: hypothetical protein HY985_12615 [Magnetospirillum sp.]|nr:hypothetical protein [Magnetospirillum sp.]
MPGFGLLGRFVAKARAVGFRTALRQGLKNRLLDPRDTLPLARVNRAGLFAVSADAIHEQEKQAIRASSLMFDASRVEATYPLIFEYQGRIMRYAFRPAAKASRGLVVLFHGHDAFLHMGPVRAWDDFDLLAPWDTFGWKRQGSWFWGEKGVPFVEELVQALIASRRAPGQKWFCTGGSMGGFASLWHGIKHGADGVYVMCPQVDLAAKIIDFGAENKNNPYLHLKGEIGGPPDLLALAKEKAELPPLFLIQNQHDHVNPFADHAWKLLEVYNGKRGWYGLRIHPSIGHGGDGKQEEAEMFFALILDKAPPKRFER